MDSCSAQEPFYSMTSSARASSDGGRGYAMACGRFNDPDPMLRGEGVGYHAKATAWPLADGFDGIVDVAIVMDGRLGHLHSK
jgi:hypothetical protein